MNKDRWKFGIKSFGELKSIYIGNAIEIVKIGKETWQNAVIHQGFLLPMFFYCMACSSYVTIE